MVGGPWPVARKTSGRLVVTCKSEIADRKSQVVKYRGPLAVSTRSSQRFASAREELRAYLAEQNKGLAATDLVDEWSKQRQSAEEIEGFYRETSAYLFDLTEWHSGKRYPYAEIIGDFAARHGCRKLLDFGCGIGADGLRLMERGFEVSFCDFRNASTEYLAWRLRQRGWDARIYYAGEDELPANDLTFAVDVIEHLVDAPQTIGDLASRARAMVFHVPITLQQHRYPMHFPVSRRALSQAMKQQGFRQVRDFSFLKYPLALAMMWEAPQFWLRNASR